MKLSLWIVAGMPIALVCLTFIAIIKLGTPDAPLWRSEPPHQSARTDRCTWACHNHGCAHHAVMPAWLTGDDGLYGQTIRWLHRTGRNFGGGNQGYAAANLLLFCVVWPLLMYGLYLALVWDWMCPRSAKRQETT